MPLLADRRTTPTDLHRSGLLNGAAAFAWWGFVFPLLLVAVNWQVARMGYVGTGAASRWDWSLEFLAHRAIWSLATCSVLLTLLGRWGEVRALRPLAAKRRPAGGHCGAHPGQLARFCLRSHNGPAESSEFGVLHQSTF